jgi:hypothetical protein
MLGSLLRASAFTTSTRGQDFTRELLPLPPLVLPFHVIRPIPCHSTLDTTSTSTTTTTPAVAAATTTAVVDGDNYHWRTHNNGTRHCSGYEFAEKLGGDYYKYYTATADESVHHNDHDHRNGHGRGSQPAQDNCYPWWMTQTDNLIMLKTAPATTTTATTRQGGGGQHQTDKQQRWPQYECHFFGFLAGACFGLPYCGKAQRWQ